MSGYRTVDPISGEDRSPLDAILLEDRRRARTEIGIFLAYAVLALAGSLFGSGLLALPDRFLPDLPVWLVSPAFVSFAALGGMILLATTVLLVHRQRRQRLTLALESLGLRDKEARPPGA